MTRDEAAQIIEEAITFLSDETDGDDPVAEMLARLGNLKAHILTSGYWTE